MSLLRCDKYGSRRRGSRCPKPFAAILTLGLMGLIAIKSTPAPAETYRWDFNNPSDYTYDSQLIGVSGGQAELLLQPEQIGALSVASYTNVTEVSQLDFGLPGAVRLSGEDGSYDAPGIFTSRIFQGDTDNVWSYLRIESASGDYAGGHPDMVAYYRMDNDNWLDQVTGATARESGTVFFSSDAMVGSHSGEFGGNGYVSMSENPLYGSSRMTVAFWTKLDDYDDFAGWIGGFSSTASFRIRQRYVYQEIMTISVATTGGGITFSFPFPLNVWRHVTLTWDGSAEGDGVPRVYIDGQEYQTGSPRTGSITYSGSLNLGADGEFASGRSMRGNMDDVLFLSTALSGPEVQGLYLREARVLKNIQLQIRSGDDRETLESRDFVGPNGTTNSTYAFATEQLVSSGQFSTTDPYVQYRAVLHSDAFGSKTPYLRAAGFIGNKTYAIDNTAVDFDQGSYDLNTRNVRSAGVRPYLALAKRSNGGYYTNGVYYSRVFDAGLDVTWDQLSWKLPETVSEDTIGLVSLWRLDGNWQDAKGLHTVIDLPDAEFTFNSKLGTKAALFNGFSNHVTGFGDLGTIRTIEFWLLDRNSDDEIMRLSASAALSVTGSLVTVQGAFSSPPVIYVNASNDRRLLNGWNHVAVVFPAGVAVPALDVGRTSSGYMHGMLDELAMYSRALTSAEVAEHYIAGNRASGGSVELQVGFGNNLDPFVGPGGSPETAFTIPPFAGDKNLAGTLPNQRYFQYSVRFKGNGSFTPAVESVQATCSSPITPVFKDDTAEKFLQGTFVDEHTTIVGDLIALQDLSAAGPESIDPSAASPIGLWLLDDMNWATGDRPVIATRGTSGRAYGDAMPTLVAKLGIRAGLFGGGGGYLDSLGIPFGLQSGDFSVSLWFNTKSNARRTLITTDDPNRYFEIEVNSDGLNSAPGRVAFVCSDAGGSPVRVASLRSDLRNGQWHHVVGVRAGSQFLLYVDGERAGGAVSSSFSGVGDSANLLVGTSPAKTSFYQGYIDEIAIFNRAISEKEIGQNFGGWARTRKTGYYQSRVFERDQPSIWQTLSWAADAPYGRHLDTGDDTIVALWRMEDTGSPITNSVAANPLDGVVSGATAGAAGRFGKALDFDAANSAYVRVAHDPALEPVGDRLTVEAWIYMDEADNRTVLDKSAGGNGYSLTTDEDGRPSFRLGGDSCTAFMPARAGKWTHVAGVYDGSNITLYVDGNVEGVGESTGNLASGADLWIGRQAGGTGYFDGRIDEVAIHERALGDEEILDHYRAGIGTLKFQARVANTNITAQPFVGPGGSTNTYFLDFFGSDLTGQLDLGKFFQYRAVVDTEDARWGPQWGGSRIFVSGYPVNNPTIEPVESAGYLFPGHLIAFSENRSTNNNTGVKYQVSGDAGSNNRWFYWDGGEWKVEDLFGMTPVYDYQASSAGMVNDNIGAFYLQHYNASGGLFRFRAFLHSEGEQPQSLDWVQLEASVGRVVITAPNGTENGDKSWLGDVPYDITWAVTPGVTGTATIQYSSDGGNVWRHLNPPATAVDITALRHEWLTPASPLTTQYLIRIRHNTDPSIYDQSDNTFTVTRGLQIVEHNGGEPTWYIGDTEDIVWRRGYQVAPAYLDFMPYDGETNFVRLVATPIGPLRINTYAWTIPMQEPMLLSEEGRLRAISGDGQYFDLSDETFVLAGAVLTRPGPGGSVKKGAPYALEWYSAGCGPEVRIELQPTAASPWQIIDENAPNLTGFNTYIWTPTNNPTEEARIRITSITDPRADGVSETFTIAAIDLVQPVGAPNLADAEKLLQHTQYPIIWKAGGAADYVNILLSTNSGGEGGWIAIETNWPNLNGADVSNVYNWTVSPFPSETVRVRVEDAVIPDELAGESPYDFQIAGLRVTWPNGPVDLQQWPKGEPRDIRWDVNAAGLDGTVEFSYDNGISWSNIVSGPILLTRKWPYTPVTPTVRGLVRITADDPAPFSNVWDQSDFNFAVSGLKITAPELDSLYTIGTTALVTFVAAATRDADGYPPIYYAGDGVNYDRNNPINTPDDVVLNENYPGIHNFEWVVEPTRTPSINARLRVEAGTFFAESPRFTIRGIKFNQPAPGTVWAAGPHNLTWSVAGLSPDAVGRVDVSVNGRAGPFDVPVAEGFFVSGGQASWTIPPDLGPATNTILRIRVTNSSLPADDNFTAYSEPFVLQGIRVEVPTNGAAWALGESRQLRWTAAAGGSSVNIFYSAEDGATYETAPIATFVNSVDGVNTRSWNIQMTRRPSWNARVKVVSRVHAGVQGVSEPFVMQGIKVTKPTSTDIYATTDATNLISWVGVNAAGAVTYDVFYIRQNNPPVLIQANVSGTTINWSIPQDAISDEVRIAVTDGTFTNISEVFQVVDRPTIQISEPAANAYWGVGTDQRIEWIRGGSMENAFDVWYSRRPYAVTNQLSEGDNVEFDPQKNVFWIPWHIPDELGQTKIIVEHKLRPDVIDTSAVFNIVGRFEMVTPTNGMAFFALKPNTPVIWRTIGSVPFVDVYYSLSEEHDAASWVKANTAPIENNFRRYDPGDVAGSWAQKTYPWTVANARTPYARVRVQEAAYTEKFDSGAEGPYADSDGEFRIQYYTVYWNVYDSETSNRLDKLAVIDSSGWSASDLSNQGDDRISNDYPWGLWNTEWYRVGYFDKRVLGWASENLTISIPGPRVWTQNVAMVQSLVDPDYHVLASFSYDADSQSFTIHSWLERRGEILDTAGKSTVHIYDEDGDEIDTLVNSTPLPNGVFWTVWDASSLDAKAVYFAKVDIEFSGFTYSSGLTFTLQVPVGLEVRDVLEEVLSTVQSNILTDVSGVESNLTRLRGDIGNLRAITEAGFSNLTDIARQTTNLISQVRGDVTNIAADVGLLTNQMVAVVGPTLRGITNQMSILRADTEQSLARILTRPDVFVFGTTNTVLYKTSRRLATAPTISVEPSGYSASMAEVAAGLGIYEHVLTADWGIGNYTITCTDPGNGPRDSLIIRVVAQDIYSLPQAVAGLSNRLDEIETRIVNIAYVTEEITNTVSPMLESITVDLDDLADKLTNIVSADIGVLLERTEVMQTDIVSLTNALLGVTWDALNQIRTDVGSLTNQLAILENLDYIASAVQSMTNAVAVVAQITNISEQVAILTNVLYNANWGEIRDMAADVRDLTNMVAVLRSEDLSRIAGDLNLLTNTLYDVDWEIVGRIQSDVSSLTNILAGFNIVSNMAAQVNELAAALPTVYADIKSVTNTLANLPGLQGIADQLSSLSNSLAVLGSLTNITLQVDAIADAVVGTDFTIMAERIGAITNQLALLGDLEFISDQLRSLTNAVAGLSSVTNLAGQIAGLTNVLVWSDVLEIKANVSSITNTLTRLDGLGALAEQIGGLSNSLVSISGVTNMFDQMTFVSDALRGINLGMMATNISAITNTLAGFDWTTITDIRDNVVTATNILAGLTELQTITAQLSDLTNSIQALSGVTNLAYQIAGITNALAGLDWRDVLEIKADMSNVTNTLASLTQLEEIASQLSALTNSMQALSGITNLGVQVSGITNALAGLDWQDIRDIRSDISGITNTLAGLTALDAIADQLGSLSNMVYALGAMTNVPAQVDELVASLAGVDFVRVAADLTSITNVLSGFQWSDVTALRSDVSGITNRLAAFDWAVITDIQSTMNNVTNTLVKLSGLDEVADKLASLTNTIQNLTGVTNLAVQISGLTNALGRVDWNDILAIKSDMATVTNALVALDNLDEIIAQLQILTNNFAIVGDVTNMAGQVEAVAAALDGVDVGAMSRNINTLTNTLATFDWEVVAGIGNNVQKLTNTIAVVTDLGDAVARLAGLTNAVADLSGLTNLAVQVGDLTNALGRVDWNDILAIRADIGAMTNTLANLEGLRSVPDQLGNLSNALAAVSIVTNIAAQVDQVALALSAVDLTALSADIASLTNAVGGVSLPAVARDITGMTNTLAALGSLQDVADQLAVLTNTVSGLSSLTNIPNQIAGLSNALAGVDFNAMMAGLSSVTNVLVDVDWNEVQVLARNVNALTNALLNVDWTALASLRDIPAISTGVTAIAASVSGANLGAVDLVSIERKLGVSTDPANANTFFGRLARVSESLNSIGSSADRAAQTAQSAKTEAGNASTGIRKLKDALEEGDLEGVNAALRELRASIELTQREVAQIPKGVEMAPLIGSVNDTAATIQQFAAQGGFNGMLDMIEKLPEDFGKGGAELDAEELGKFDRNVQDMRDSLIFLQKLVDEKRYEPVVEESWLGVQ